MAEPSRANASSPVKIVAMTGTSAAGAFAGWWLLVWLAAQVCGRTRWLPDVPNGWPLLVPSLAAICCAYAAGRAFGRCLPAAGPALVVALAAPVAAAAAGVFGVMVYLFGGCGWDFATAYGRSPTWRVVLGPLFGGVIGGVIATAWLVVRSWNDPTPRPATTGENVNFLVARFTPDPWDEVWVVGQKLLRDAFAPDYAATIVGALILVGSANAALVGFASILGRFWDVLGWGALAVGLAAGVLMAEVLVRRAAGSDIVG